MMRTDENFVRSEQAILARKLLNEASRGSTIFCGQPCCTGGQNRFFQPSSVLPRHHPLHYAVGELYIEERESCHCNYVFHRNQHNEEYPLIGMVCADCENYSLPLHRNYWLFGDWYLGVGIELERIQYNPSLVWVEGRYAATTDYLVR